MNAYKKAVLFVVMAYLAITVMSIFVKLASSTIPPSQILFARFFLGTLFILPFAIKGKQLRLRLQKIHFFIFRNLAGIVSMLLTFYAIKYLPVSIAILLMNTSALFVPLILRCFGIKTPPHKIGLILLGFLGIAVILLGSDGGSSGEIFYIFIALLSAVLAGIAYCSLQELNKYNSPQNIVFYFHLIGTIVLGGMFFYEWVALSLSDFYLLLLVGVFGLIFQICLTKAFQYASASDITPFTFIGVVFSGLFDALFLNIQLPITFWLGTLIVVVAMTLLAKNREISSQ